VRLTSLARRNTSDNLSTIGDGLFTVEGTLLNKSTLATSGGRHYAVSKKIKEHRSPCDSCCMHLSDRKKRKIVQNSGSTLWMRLLADLTLGTYLLSSKTLADHLGVLVNPSGARGLPLRQGSGGIGSRGSGSEGSTRSGLSQGSGEHGIYKHQRWATDDGIDGRQNGCQATVCGLPCPRTYKRTKCHQSGYKVLWKQTGNGRKFTYTVW
jgi:hypothetical protein